MSPLHHLDSRDARERKCPGCEGWGRQRKPGARYTTMCDGCRGTGRLAAREPDVEVWRSGSSAQWYTKYRGVKGKR